MTSNTIRRATPCAVLVLTLACIACQHPGDPPPKTTVAPKQPPEAQEDEGERLADIAAAHRKGSPGPALTLTTIDGDTIDLAKLYGAKPVYLKFWATWCTPCREQMAAFEHIYETLGDRMQVIAVNVGLNDDEAAVRAFRKQYGLRMPVVLDDGRLAAALNLQVTPQHVLIGRDARIAFMGHLDGDRLHQAIQNVLTGPGSSGAATSQAVTIHPAFRPGDRVQGLQATTLDGAVVPLGPSPDGRPRGLVLFTSWCESYLEKSQPQASQACRRVREEVDGLIARGDVAWLGISSGPWSTAEDLADYRSKTSTKIPLALDTDGALFRAFGVHQVPTVALLDSNGRVVRILGPNDGDLTAAVDALTARK